MAQEKASLMPASHNETIIAQFSRMADVFSSAPQFTDRESLDVLLRATQASAADTSLDVACGAGVVAAHFAGVVQHATGIDITPAMLHKARERQAQLELHNLSWHEGDVANLPYPDQQFSIVTSRFAFHHMADPGRVLQEMVRVCKPQGRMAVADISLPDDPCLADVFNRLERNHDPSHVAALTETQWSMLFTRAGLSGVQQTRYQVVLPLHRLLEAGRASPEVRRSAEQELREHVTAGRLQPIVRLDNDRVMFVYPIAVMSAIKPIGAA